MVSPASPERRAACARERIAGWCAQRGMFGPQRMFWGTDLARLPCTYRQAVTMFTEEIPWLTHEDKEWIMGRALCGWLGWRLPAHA
jgi:hypothetical protein